MDTESTKNGTFFRFEDLRVYHKALDYIDWVYNSTREFPENNSETLARRFIHSAQAIAFYIAEGSARNKTQFVHYLKMAKSSVRECVVITTVAEKQKLLTEMLIDESRNELMEMTKMIGALIGSLQRASAKGKTRFRHGDNGDGDSDSEDEYNYNVTGEDELISSNSLDMNKY
jgi:four helix bundle protein